MIEVGCSIIIGLFLLFTVEKLNKQKRISSEVSRKIIHVISGLAVVSWAFFVSWQTIIWIEILYILAAYVLRKSQLLKSQQGINRVSWGEFFFSVGVILTIILDGPRWIFVLAILHLSLADAAAALVGIRYGKKNSYKILGHKKSVVGGLAFFAVSCVLVGLVFVVTPGNITTSSTIALLALPFVTTLVESLGVYGLDNLLIPLVVVLLLHP